MRFLFLHPNFPAQFRYILKALACSGEHEIVFLTENNESKWPVQGLQKIVVPEADAPLFGIKPVVIPFLKQEARGQVYLQACIKLKKSGFVPDVVVFHSGWGASWYIADIFPSSRLVGYFEWFYTNNIRDKNLDNQILNLLQTRMRNAAILNDLHIVHQKITPTWWQQSQFPRQYQNDMEVIHEGLDTSYFTPEPDNDLSFLKCHIPDDAQLVTYAARGMEPYRGFPQFMKSLEHVLSYDKTCHVIIIGSDRVCYSPVPVDGKTYKQQVCENLQLDWSRIHFVGSLPYGQYKKVLQASTVHVYLTVPFVLSWSMLEAMACGCVVIGSDSPPVLEVIKDGENGIIAELDSLEDIGKKILAVLNFPDIYATMRERARNTIVTKYELQNSLLHHCKILLQARVG